MNAVGMELSGWDGEGLKFDVVIAVGFHTAILHEIWTASRSERLTGDSNA